MDIIREVTFRRPESACRVSLFGKPDLLHLPGRPLYVFDENTFPLFSEQEPPQKIIFPPGEEHKSLASVEDILSTAVENTLPRTGVIAGVGGGVICDMAAFAASIYMRGCRLVLVPTSLLAMVDAAVGGKTGVDYGGYKNLAGSFYPAEEVRVCPDVLESLPEEEYINGLAEVVKYAFLGERGILDLLEKRLDGVLQRSDHILSEIITRSIDMKADYITEDPLERGIRAHLNFGHTFAHALEFSGGLRNWTHGRAVAWGMVMALRLGRLLGITPQSYVEFAEELIGSCGFTTRIELSRDLRETLLEAMTHDKKNVSANLTFVLQAGCGETLVREVDPAAVREVLS